MEKALRATSTGLGLGQRPQPPPRSPGSETRQTLPPVQLAHCRLSPKPSRIFRGVPTPVSCPGLPACLDLLAEGAHHKRSKDRPRAGPKPRREEPTAGQTRWKLTQSRLGSPQTLGTASLTPRAQPGHIQPGQPGTEALSCQGLRSQPQGACLLGSWTRGWAHATQQPQGLCQVLRSRLGGHCPGGAGGLEGAPHLGSGSRLPASLGGRRSGRTGRRHL